MARIRECIAVHKWAVGHTEDKPCAFCTGLLTAIMTVGMPRGAPHGCAPCVALHCGNIEQP